MESTVSEDTMESEEKSLGRNRGWGEGVGGGLLTSKPDCEAEKKKPVAVTFQGLH